jgi:galactokinase
VTGARLVERLAERGLDPVEIPAKTALYESAAAGLPALSSAAPAYASWVPGRLEVFGKHTDYAGGRTLVAALPRGFAFLAAPRTDGDVHILDARTGERLTIAARDDAVRGWRHYVQVVVARLARNFPGARRGASIAFISDLPRASGMSSSSALVVGIAAALAQLWNLKAREEWRRNIHDVSAAATYYACLENGRTFGTLQGDAGVGTHGGSEDHAAMLLGKSGELSAFSFVPIRHVGDAPVPGSWQFVIASSGATSEKTGAARQAYNRLSEGVEILLRLWNAAGQQHDSLAAALASSASATDRLRGLIRGSTIAGWPSDALERRLEHFQSEDALVVQALGSFQQTDATCLGALSDISQHNAQHLLENQVPETIALTRDARQCGALAACSFGAGFGGSVWAISDSRGAADFADRWLRQYRERYPMRAGATSFIATPGPSLTELTL